MRDGGAEGRHDRIADELLDRAAVALDLLAQAGVIGADAGLHVLRVLLLGGGGKADQVAEEDRDDLALLERGCRPLGERSRAVAAEREPVGVLLAATRADEHTPSL